MKLGKFQQNAWEDLTSTCARIWVQIEKEVSLTEGTIPLHWYQILLVLNHSKNKRLRLAELAERIQTSRGALGRSVNKMSSQELIKKEDCEDDGRGQFAAITRKGEIAFNKTKPVYQKAIHTYFGKKLTNQQSKALIEVLLLLRE